MRSNLITVTMELIKNTNKNDLTITKVYITYKIIIFCYNNGIILTDDEVEEKVNHIYELHNDNYEPDFIDITIEKELSK